MGRQVQLALIGTGAIAARYAHEIALNPAAVLRAVTSRNPEQARRFADEHPSACCQDTIVYDDVHDLLQDPGIEGVLVCTWHDSHVSIGIECLLAGKSVFMEKPLALSSVDCLPLARLCARSNAVFMMGGFGFRYYNGNVFRLLGYIGRPVLIHGRLVTPRWPDDFWAMKPGIGGGVIFSVGSHLMDMACLVSRSEPVNVMAFGHNLSHPDSGVVDTMSVVIDFENSATASLAFGDCGELPPFGEITLEVFDGTRAVRIPQFLPTDLAPTFYERHGYFAEGNASDPGTFDLTGKPLTPIDEFVGSLQNGQQSDIFPGIKEGIRAVVLLEKAFSSIEQGKCQRVERCSPEDGYYR